MSVSLERYRPPFVTQRGIDSTLDDCAVVATLVGLAYATLGEYVTTPQGREMGKAQLHALARRMRDSLGPSEATGGLGNDDQREMCRKAGYPRPDILDLAFPRFRALARERVYAFSVGGDPSRIKGPSPLKRCDCAHEWLVAWDPACGPHKLRVYDGLRTAGPRYRGEAVPARQIRQMSFRDSDGELTGVLAFPIGRWTSEELTAAKLRSRLKTKNATIRSQRAAAARAARDLLAAGAQIESLKRTLEDLENDSTVGNLIGDVREVLDRYEGADG